MRSIPEYIDDYCQDLRVAYECIIRMAALYGEARQVELRQEFAEDWRQLSNSVLGDVGRVHLIWKKAGALGGEWRVGSSDFRPVRLVFAQQIRRLDLVNRRMNVWSPMKRWLRVLTLCERRWIHAMRKLARIGVDTQGLLSEALKNAEEREVTLAHLLASLEADTTKNRSA